jgi:flagellar FliL protein
MAEEEANDNGEAGGEAGGGRGKQLLVIGAAVVLALVIGAAGAWWFLGGDSGGSGATGSAAKPAPAPAQNQAPGELHELPGFVVNLARSSRTRYLKTTVQLELNGKPMVKKAKERQPQLRDALIILLSNQSVEGLQTMQGKYELKRQMVARLNNLLGDGAVRNVYFTEFVIQ